MIAQFYLNEHSNVKHFLRAGLPGRAGGSGERLPQLGVDAQQCLCYYPRRPQRQRKNQTMDCPRCGVSVFTDLSNCRACGWQLARPFDGQTLPLGSGQAGVSAPPNHFSSSSGVAQTFVSALSSKEPKREPLIQTAADAFALSPPQRVQRVHRPRRAARQQQWSDAGAVAVLPSEARWEATPRLEVIEMP